MSTTTSQRNKRTVPYCCLAFEAARGDIVAAGDSRGNVVILWLKRNRYRVWRAGTHTVAALAFVGGGKEVLVSMANCSVVCLNIATGDVVATLPREHALPPQLRASGGADAGLVLTVSPERAILWSTSNWQKQRVLGPGAGIVQARFVGGSLYLLFADDTVLCWSTRDFTLKHRYLVPADEGRAGLACFAPTSDALVAGGANAMLYLWDLGTEIMGRVAEMPPSANSVVAIEALHKTDEVAVLGDDGTLLVLSFTLAGCQVVLEIGGPSASVIKSFDFGPHDKYLASVTVSGTMDFYDLAASRRNALELVGARQLSRTSSLALHVRSPFSEQWQDTTVPATVDGHDQSSPLATQDPNRPPPPVRKSGVVKGLGDAALPPSAVPSGSQGRRNGRPSRAQTTASPNEPPFRLAQRLGEADLQLNMQRIMALLKAHGQFPSKYRQLIWRFLLQLPENHAEFTTLLGKGVHPAFEGTLAKRYPLRNSRLLRKLELVVSALAHWSPVCGEIEYLPATAFPFVSFFETDDLCAFETCMAVVLHWQRHFLCTFPHPPIPVLNALEQGLNVEDPQLVDHLKMLGAGPQAYGWPLLRTIFTEVLTRDEWLQLWDHLFAWHETPNMLLVAVIAYLTINRSTILGIKDVVELERYVHVSHPIDMQRFVKTIWHLATRGKSAGMFQDSALLNPANAEAELAVALGDTPWPIPRGTYPSFLAYPKFVVDFQIEERKRIADEEAELRQKQILIDEVTRRSQELSAQEARWQQQQQAVLAAEQHRRQKTQEAHERTLNQAEQLERRRQALRLEFADQLERSAEKALERSTELQAVHAARIRDEMEWSTRRLEIETNLRMGEEQVLDKEQATQRKLQNLQAVREEQQRTRAIEAELLVKRHAIATEDKSKSQLWRLQDEEAKQAWLMEEEARARKQRAQVMAADQMEMEKEFLKFSVEREAEMAAVEQRRKLRELREAARKSAEGNAEVLETAAKLSLREDLANIEAVVGDARMRRLEKSASRMTEAQTEKLAALAEREASERMALAKAKEVAEREKDVVIQRFAESEKQRDIEDSRAHADYMAHMQEERMNLRLGKPRPAGSNIEAFERQVDEAVAAAEESLYMRGESGDTEEEGVTEDEEEEEMIERTVLEDEEQDDGESDEEALRKVREELAAS